MVLRHTRPGRLGAGRIRKDARRYRLSITARSIGLMRTWALGGLVTGDPGRVRGGRAVGSRSLGGPFGVVPALYPRPLRSRPLVRTLPRT